MMENIVTGLLPLYINCKKQETETFLTNLKNNVLGFTLTLQMQEGEHNKSNCIDIRLTGNECMHYSSDYLLRQH